MRTKNEVLEELSLFSIPADGGIGGWLTDQTYPDIFNRLARIEQEPLSPVQLNQLLVLGHEAPISDGFFRYYFLEAPKYHPYRTEDVPGYSDRFIQSEQIVSLDHLKWGMYRLYTDALLYFGNIRTSFRALRDLDYQRLSEFFRVRRYDTEGIKRRGPPLPLKQIAKDSRYLISEMACKSYGEPGSDDGDLHKALVAAFKASTRKGKPSPTIKELLEQQVSPEADARQTEFLFSADEMLNERVVSEKELLEKYRRIANKFSEARKAALDNTCYYLSLANDLDVYVATSMRTRQDFRHMAETCERIFSDRRLKELNLRYFDPTLSAAGGHEDKGLIECLMVKCAKALVLCAGEGDSYGKDAEAAMALSLGKPVIFYCNQEKRSRFYRDVHPLSRLIEFETGVAVGAMVTDKIEEVVELLSRTFGNRLTYRLEQPKPGFLRLKETVTESVVRLQTNDTLLNETFWNHYHKDRRRHRKIGVGSV